MVIEIAAQRGQHAFIEFETLTEKMLAITPRIVSDGRSEAYDQGQDAEQAEQDEMGRQRTRLSSRRSEHHLFPPCPHGLRRGRYFKRNY